MNTSSSGDRSFSENLKLAIAQKSNWNAIRILAQSLVIYGLCLWGALAEGAIALNVGFSLLLGTVLAQLFVIGHDAGHQSLAQTPRLNQAIARFTLALTLHSYPLWHLEHNVRHHRHTNILGIDPSWSAFTKAEFDQLSPLRQALERIYRSPWGAGLYYLLEMWLKLHSFPVRPAVRQHWKRYLPDSLLISLSLALQLISIGTLGTLLAPDRPLAIHLLLGWGIPFLIWNWLMGFSIYLHHTHPDIPWFSPPNKLPLSQQPTLTAHVIFPSLLTRWFHNIMEHGAHHGHPALPMHQLADVQSQLETVHGAAIVRYRWTLREYLRITRTCKLFDLDQCCWTDFNGHPTTAAIAAVPTPQSSPLTPLHQ